MIGNVNFTNISEGDDIFVYSDNTGHIQPLPLVLDWAPLKDISVYDLACSMPFLLRIKNVLPHEFNKGADYAKHWTVRDPN